MGTPQPNYASLTKDLEGPLLTDKLSRGLYSTDASVYQMLPQAVMQPKSLSDIQATLSFASNNDLAVLPRGAGTSQNGQTVNDAVVLDFSRYYNGLIELDVENLRCVVQPGMVLDSLNKILKPHGLWFPVDVSTASRATIGGMCGNNSCGQRSIVYGTMRHNVRSLDALAANGSLLHFGQWQKTTDASTAEGAAGRQHFTPKISDWTSAETPDPNFVSSLFGLAGKSQGEILDRFPRVLRRVGGYNLDALIEASELEQPQFQQFSDVELPPDHFNLSGLMVGSEGTLATTTAVELKLSPLPGQRVLGVCHFPTFYQAMDAAQHLVKLKPTAIELVDSTMISLARDIEAFQPVLEQFVQGDPAALLLVEFSSESQADNLSSLAALTECMGDLGFSWRASGNKWGGVAEVIDPGLQSAIGEVRKSGLNIMMSMKSEGKPVSFVEDCAVELGDLADYTQGLTEIFEKHNTRGTWYAHASVGCLHVRPVLNLKLEKDRHSMREIAAEAFDLVASYKGSHSGEHGDGISRSEFHEKMFGKPLVDAFTEVKQLFDANNRFNPGRIVNAPRMNERSLLRYHDQYAPATVEPQLDWSAWPEAQHGLQAAVEMCNNNGACRKLSGGAMCPSYRATREEKDVTRGRANALRLALSGQLPAASGESALAGDDLFEALELCVSCKACKRECPTGVDMARMKLEVLAAREAAGKHGLHEKLVAEMPLLASKLASVPLASALVNLLNKSYKLPLIGDVLERVTGFSRSRKLPLFVKSPFKESECSTDNTTASPDSSETSVGTVILWADTFNRYFEPDNLRAAVRVLKAAGYNILFPTIDGERPLCCGRTWLSTGKVAQAKRELERTRAVLNTMLMENKEAVLIGLEPSCLLTFRDELTALLPGADSELLASKALLFEEFLAAELDAGRLKINFRKTDADIRVHGHCHQKAFGQMEGVGKTLQMIPGATVTMIESSCCGMAGSFGYQRKTAEISKQMAALDLLPAVREAIEAQHAGENGAGAVEIVADGTSCRHQILDGSGVQASHVACVLARHLA